MGDIIDFETGEKKPKPDVEAVTIILWLDPSSETFNVSVEETCVPFDEIAGRLRDVAEYLEEIN